MNNLPLQPLVWARIDTSKTDGIWCNKTSSYIEGAVSFCSTPVADYVIRKDKETGKYKTNYGGRTENPYDTIDDAEHWAEFTHYASQMQPYVKQDSTQRIENWFKAAKPEPTTRDVCTQIGCHYEEISEMDVALYEPTDNEQLADWYKGKFINESNVMERMDKLELLDSLCDQIVTAIGVGYMMGFDIQGALNEVIRSNNSKKVGGKFEFDDNGKISKPSSYSEPDLTPFVGD